MISSPLFVPVNQLHCPGWRELLNNDILSYAYVICIYYYTCKCNWSIIRILFCSTQQGTSCIIYQKSDNLLSTELLLVEADFSPTPIQRWYLSISIDQSTLYRSGPGQRTDQPPTCRVIESLLRWPRSGHVVRVTSLRFRQREPADKQSVKTNQTSSV